MKQHATAAVYNNDNNIVIINKMSRTLQQKTTIITPATLTVILLKIFAICVMI
jgi:hypothetical protein